MSALPISEQAPKSRIGDILLAHGFVTQAELADAVVEQERTHQPLGQILVGRGAITRLELASALAEQWSDPAASIGSSRSTLAPAPSEQDEAQYAARLQEAVADLARRVESSAPLDGIDERVEELSRRIEATFARTQHIEAAVATLAESLEGVTGGVEEAFYALQSGTADLADDLARIDRTVGELVAHPAAATDGDGPTIGDLEELRAAVAAIGESGPADDALRERVEALAEQIASTPAVEEIRRSLNGLDARVESLAALAGRIDRLEATAGSDDVRTSIETQAATIDGLRTIVQELRSRPAGDPDLGDRLEGLESRLEATVASTAGLSTSVEELERRGGEQTQDPRVDGILERLGRLEALVSDGLEGIGELRTAVANRPDDLHDPRVDELAQSVDAAQREVAELTSAARAGAEAAATVQALADRVDVLSHQGPELEARLDALGAGREQESELPARIDALEAARSSDLDMIDVLAQALDRIRHDLTKAPEPVVADTTAIEHEVEALSSRIGEIEQLRLVLERVGLHLAEHDRALADLGLSRVAPQRVDELAGRIEALTHGGVATPGAPATLAAQDDGVEALLRRVEEAEAASRSDGEKLLSQLERMASSIDWRLQRLETDDDAEE